MEEIVNIISTVGFPIFACCALFWMNDKESQRHAEETEKFTNALAENTLVLQKLCDKLDTERSETDG